MAALAVTAIGALTAGAAQAATVKQIAGAPLTLWVGDQGQFQGHREGDSANIFFNPGNEAGDAGFFLAFPATTGQNAKVQGRVFGFQGNAGPFTSPDPAQGLQDYAPISQGDPTGAGTAGDPLKQVTVYDVPDTADTANRSKDLMKVTQTTTYVNGAQQFDVRWDVQNISGGALPFKALVGADFYFEGSDVGTGIFTQGPPRFIGGTNADTGRSGGFVEAPGPSPAWSHYQALPYASSDGNDVWTRVQDAANSASASYDDTVVGEPVDNAGAVEWDQPLTAPLGAGQTATYAVTVRTATPSALQFDQTNAGAPQGVPITFTVTAVDTAGNPFPGKTLRYTITGANPGSGSATLDAAGSGRITDPGTNAGPDTIVAFVDFNNNGTREPVEPQGSALATFVDKVAPSCTVKVSGDRPVSSGGQGKPLMITVSCGEAATVTTTSSLAVTPPARRASARAAASAKKKRKHKKRRKVVVKLPRATAVVQPGQATPIAIRIPASVTKKYPGATVKATVTITAVDAAGNRATARTTRTIKIAKKKKAKRRHHH